ncbi:PREDICTED: putative L-aspartate dehydrogenase isoform X2 [Lepidothrix coronata]|uniref:Aspartate dehydrogenase domain-containing protein n=1 Tax=Lepidothrix coronata TaxID=321398 RepID=A0A6J0J8X6_9PASS|nr:PREDICTED: putative L-aspartate dehydrogenase isoform X2 [Lepidothrix coronata]
MEAPRSRRVGILGYGQLGQFLAQQLLARGPPLGLTLAWVWARDGASLEGLPPALRLPDLGLLPSTGVDLVVEVAHPCLAQEHGEDILRHADFMALKVTMTKSPQSFRAQGWLRERVAAAVASGTRTVLYEGPLRPLCPLAPNNVNTMAAAAVAAPGLGFDGVTACLVADPSVPDWHVVEVEVTSVGDKGRCLSVTSIRRNPAGPGAVTGSATLGSFWSSLQACTGHGGCVRLC